MRHFAIGFAVATLSVLFAPSAWAQPADGPCAFLGAIGPNQDGDSYLRCTESGWMTVNRPVCADFPGMFDCAGNPVRVGPKYTIPGEGTFRPSIDIRPGDYRTSGPASAGQSCSWVLHHDVGVVSASSEGPASVVIAPTDKGFQSSGCQPWNPMY